jgi:hypothetical protein
MKTFTANQVAQLMVDIEKIMDIDSGELPWFIESFVKRKGILRLYKKSGGGKTPEERET